MLFRAFPVHDCVDALIFHPISSNLGAINWGIVLRAMRLEQLTWLIAACGIVLYGSCDSHRVGG